MALPCTISDHPPISGIRSSAWTRATSPRRIPTSAARRTISRTRASGRAIADFTANSGAGRGSAFDGRTRGKASPGFSLARPQDAPHAQKLRADDRNARRVSVAHSCDPAQSTKSGPRTDHGDDTPMPTPHRRIWLDRVVSVVRGAPPARSERVQPSIASDHSALRCVAMITVPNKPAGRFPNSPK